MLTHDELLSRIDKNWDADYDYCDERRTQALRAVVEIHKPVLHSKHNYICEGCNLVYPCDTIEAIEKELQ
jgi:hypothetical protein